MARRNKRILDLIFSVLFFLTLPIGGILVGNGAGFIRNIFLVFRGKKSWVGYERPSYEKTTLPSLRPGVLFPTDTLQISSVDEATIHRLNFFYAKDYRIGKDLDIIWKGYQNLGRN